MLLYLRNKASILPRKQNQVVEMAHELVSSETYSRRLLVLCHCQRLWKIKPKKLKASSSARILCSKKCNTNSSESLWHNLQQIPVLPCKKKPKQCANLCHITALITERDPSSVRGLRIFICWQRKQAQCELRLHKLRNCTGSIMM